MDTVHAAARLTWSPWHTWSRTSTHIDGALSDGRQLDIATTADPDIPSDLRAATIHSWLHGRVCVLTSTDDTPPIVVLPGTYQLSSVMLAEAIHRWVANLTDPTLAPDAPALQTA